MKSRVGTVLPLLVLGIIGLVLVIGMVPQLWTQQAKDQILLESTVSLPLQEVATKSTIEKPSTSFQVGDQVKTEEWAHTAFCAYAKPQQGKVGLPECPYRSDGNFIYTVEISGPAERFGTNYFYYPVTIVQASSVYGEGVKGWILERALIEQVEVLSALPKPSVQTGDKGRLDYNFVPRKTPEGERVYVDEWVVIYGGLTKVIVLENPVLGRDTHWWCKIQAYESIHALFEASDYQVGLIGWVPCEITKE